MVRYTDLKVGDSIFTKEGFWKNRTSRISKIEVEANMIFTDDGFTTSLSGVGHFHQLSKDDELIDIEEVCDNAMYVTGLYCVCDSNSECSTCPHKESLQELALEKYDRDNNKDSEV